MTPSAPTRQIFEGGAQGGTPEGRDLFASSVFASGSRCHSRFEQGDEHRGQPGPQPGRVPRICRVTE